VSLLQHLASVFHCNFELSEAQFPVVIRVRLKHVFSKLSFRLYVYLELPAEVSTSQVQLRGCDLLVIVNVDLLEDMEEVGVRDLVVLSDRLDSPARPSEVPYDVQELIQLYMLHLPPLLQQPLELPVHLKED